MATHTINGVEDFLRFSADFRKQCSRPADWRYCCFEELVLSHGRKFDQIIRRPKWIKKGVIKECFSNCLKELMRYPDRLVYCEGYATGVIPVHHAWLLYEGKVIDPTWDGRDIIKDHTEYFGIPFNYNYVLRVATETGYYGVIDNFTQRFPLLSGEHESDEFLCKII